MPGNYYHWGLGWVNDITANQPGVIAQQNAVAEALDVTQQIIYANAALMQQIFEAPAPSPVPQPVEDEEGTMINDFKVGCDPEFLILGPDNKTVMALHYFQHYGPIGYDHGGRVAEFRPEPTKGVLPIVRKIKELIHSEAMKNTLNTKLRAGALCNGDALGGHVHFGFNCFKVKPAEGTNIHAGGEFNERGAKVTKALDTLTKTLEHLDILPATECARRRLHGQGYGRYGDVRDCNGHMEYRTMASWLFDPKVAFLCLTAAKLAAADPDGTTEALKGCDSFAKLQTWIEQYKTKDLNAARTVEKLLDHGHKYLQIDPEVDFRGRWETLGV